MSNRKKIHFSSHIDCLKGIKDIIQSYNRIFIGRGKDNKGYYIVYRYR